MGRSRSALAGSADRPAGGSRPRGTAGRRPGPGAASGASSGHRPLGCQPHGQVSRRARRRRDTTIPVGVKVTPTTPAPGMASILMNAVVARTRRSKGFGWLGSSETYEGRRVRVLQLPPRQPRTLTDQANDTRELTTRPTEARGVPFCHRWRRRGVHSGAARASAGQRDSTASRPGQTGVWRAVALPASVPASRHSGHREIRPRARPRCTTQPVSGRRARNLSCSSTVLMQQTAKPVAPADLGPRCPSTPGPGERFRRSSPSARCRR
jgi:hypothetical protein